MALGLQAACGGPVEFDVTQTFGTQVLGTAGSGLTTLLPKPVLFDQDIKQQAVAHGARGPVTAVEVYGTAFETGADFGFVKSVDVFIESTRTNSSLAPVRIATLSSAPGKVNRFILNSDSSVNIYPYLQEGARLRSTATGTQPTAELSFTGNCTVHVYTSL